MARGKKPMTKPATASPSPHRAVAGGVGADAGSVVTALSLRSPGRTRSGVAGGSGQQASVSGTEAGIVGIDLSATRRSSHRQPTGTFNPSAWAAHSGQEL